MIGDYWRFIAEIYKQKKAVDASKYAYEMAWNTATTELSSSHPIKLGLALNYSNFLKEVYFIQNLLNDEDFKRASESFFVCQGGF